MALESNGNNVVWLNTTRPDQIQQVCVAREASEGACMFANNDRVLINLTFKYSICDL